MRYGYDLDNPKERKMYMEKHLRNLKRMFDKDYDLSKNFAEYIKERQEEIQYFIDRDREEREREKQINERIEKELPNIIEKEVGNVIEKELKKIFK